MKGIIAEIPECKNAPEKEIEQTDDLIKFVEVTYKIACAKDEQGNFCPYSPGNPQTTGASEAMREGQRNEVYMGFIKESCKSKMCVDDYLSGLEILKTVSPTSIYTSNMNNKEMEEIATYLKSETCTAQTAQIAQNAQTSNTSVNGNNNANPSNTNASNTNASNTNASNTNASNTNANGKTNTNNNNDNKTDAENGASQVTYSSILFVSLAILLSALY